MKRASIRTVTGVAFATVVAWTVLVPGSASVSAQKIAFGRSTAIAISSASAGGTASSNGESGSTLRSPGDPQPKAGTSQLATQSSSASNRSVSVTENGRTISISESSDAGITVTVTRMEGGQPQEMVVKAANPRALKKKNPAAFDLYQRYLGSANPNRAIGGAGDAGMGGPGPADAQSLLRDQLRRLADEHANNPKVRSMIEGMLRNLGK